MIRSIAYFFILFSYVFVFLAEANDDKDRAYEDRIRSIYLKNYKKPITSEEWSKLINFLEKTYKLKYKDNFWDLSKSFFKDNLYWSKLWVANPTIENPHRIYKGDSIKFDIKTLSSVNTSKYSIPISKQFPDIKIPPQLYKQRSLREYEIPSSLPYIKENINLEPVSSEIHLLLNSIKIDRRAPLPFYLSEEKPQEVGKVLGKDSYGLMSFNGEDILVKIEGEVSADSRYTVFKNRGSLRSSLFNLLKTVGYEIQIKGEIKILHYVIGTESIYRAQVVKSLAEITEGDSVSFGSNPVFTLSQKGNYGTANGIITGSSNKKIKMLSPYSIVYLNKGTSNGVRVDDLYHIRARASHGLKKHRERPYRYKQPSIGKLRVIHASPDVSTAIIIQAKDQIYLNDFFSSSLGFISDLEKSESHESIERPKDSYELKENLLEVEESIEEDSEESKEDVEEIEEDMEEIEEDIEDVEGEESDSMKDVENEFKDLEDLEEIEEF